MLFEEGREGGSSDLQYLFFVSIVLLVSGDSRARFLCDDCHDRDGYTHIPYSTHFLYKFANSSNTTQRSD